jgi:hypothetical protein
MGLKKAVGHAAEGLAIGEGIIAMVTTNKYLNEKSGHCFLNSGRNKLTF